MLPVLIGELCVPELLERLENQFVNENNNAQRYLSSHRRVLLILMLRGFLIQKF